MENEFCQEYDRKVNIYRPTLLLDTLFGYQYTYLICLIFSEIPFISCETQDICQTIEDQFGKNMVRPCMLPFRYNDTTIDKCIIITKGRIEGPICPFENPNGTWLKDGKWGYCNRKPEGNCDVTDGKYQRLVMS